MFAALSSSPIDATDVFTTASRKTAHHHRSTRGIFIHHRARKTVSSSASTWKRSLLRWFQAWNRYASKLTRWNPKDPVNAVPSISSGYFVGED